MNGPIVNLDQLEIRQVGKTAAGKPVEGYDIRRGEIGSRIGARKLGYNLTVVAPGKRNCPFHNHRVGEEMFFILEGSGELRYGDARHPLRAGDIIACATPTAGRAYSGYSDATRDHSTTGMANRRGHRLPGAIC